MSNTKMEQLIKTLPAILQAAGDSDEVKEAACVAAWRHAAGEGLRDLAVAVRLYDKKLVVAVADAIWQKQLEPMLGQLLFRLNSILGQPLVTCIKLRVDPQNMPNSRRPQEVRKAGEEQMREDGAPAELLSAAAAIADPELRRAFLAAATSCINRLDESAI